MSAAPTEAMQPARGPGRPEPLVQDGPGEQDRRDRVEALSTATIPIEPARRGERDQSVGAGVEDADREDERAARASTTRGTVRVAREGEDERADRAEPGRRDRPRGALLRRLAEPDDEQPEAERGDAARARPRPRRVRADPIRAAPGSRETSTTPASASPIPSHCSSRRRVPREQVDGERHDRRGRRDRRHDAHRADRHAAVETPEPDGAGDARATASSSAGARPRAPLSAIQTTSPSKPDELRPEQDDQRRTCAASAGRRRSRRYPTAPPRASASTTAATRLSPRRRAGSPPGRRAGSRGRAPPPRRCAPPGGRGGRRPRGGARPGRRRRGSRRSLLDQPQPEMDVPEQTTLLGLAERRPAPELDRSPDVVQERGGEQQVVAQARVELRRLAAQRRDADRVLEQPAGVAVVPVGAGGRQRAQAPRGSPSSARMPVATAASRGWADLAGEELEKAVELVGVAPQRRRQLARDRCRARPRPPAPAPGACRRTAPRARARARRRPRRSGRRAARRRPRSAPRSARSGRRARARDTARRSSSAAAPSADGVDALDGAVLGELGDAWSRRESRGRDGTLGRWPMSPRSARFATRTRPPAVTAPPYDVLDAGAARAFRARDPHNVVHLTLNDSEDEAGRLFRTWLDEGVLVRDDEPAVWAVAQDYVGPDGVARRREGLVASLRVEPYETGTVLPHERTHAGPKESRLRLLRAARAQLEPIFLLYDGEPPVARARRASPISRRRDTRLWRLPGEGVAEAFADRQLLIADGHHRYETAVAYAAEEGTPESARMMVVLVSTSDPGLEIFPTHRLFRGHDDALPPAGVGDSASARRGRSRGSPRLPYDRAHAVGYRTGRTLPVDGRAGRARRRARRSARRPRGHRLHGRSRRGRRPRRRGRVRRRLPAPGRRGSRTCSSARAAARSCRRRRPTSSRS